MRMRGQAMVEFCVAAAVLALLFIGLPVLARYHDVQFGLIANARLAATLRSWSPQRTLDAAQLKRDAFAALDDPRRPEVRTLQATTTSARAPGSAARIADLALEPLFALGSLGGSGLDLERGGYHSVTLSARVEASDQQQLPEPFADLSLASREHHAVLGDAWNSASPAQVAERAGGLMPTSAFASLRTVLAPARLAASIIEPALRQLCLGQIDPEKVPADRLGGADNDSRHTTWVAPC